MTIKPAKSWREGRADFTIEQKKHLVFEIPTDKKTVADDDDRDENPFKFDD